MMTSPIRACVVLLLLTASIPCILNPALASHASIDTDDPQNALIHLINSLREESSNTPELGMVFEDICTPYDECEDDEENATARKKAKTCNSLDADLVDIDWEALGDDPSNWRKHFQAAKQDCQRNNPAEQAPAIQEACKSSYDKVLSASKMDAYLIRLEEVEKKQAANPNQKETSFRVWFSNTRPTAPSSSAGKRVNDPVGYVAVLWTSKGPWICTIPGLVTSPDSDFDQKGTARRVLRAFEAKLQQARQNEDELKGAEFRDFTLLPPIKVVSDKQWKFLDDLTTSVQRETREGTQRPSLDFVGFAPMEKAPGDRGVEIGCTVRGKLPTLQRQGWYCWIHHRKHYRWKAEYQKPKKKWQGEPLFVSYTGVTKAKQGRIGHLPTTGPFSQLSDAEERRYPAPKKSI